MGIRFTRPVTLTEIRMSKSQTDLLAAQELAATLYEENAKKDARIVDLETVVSGLYEGSVK